MGKITTGEFEGVEIVCEDWGYVKINGEHLHYISALEALHPKLRWEHFGFGYYQGEYVSIGMTMENKVFLKQGYYGSCSVCDWVEGIGDVDGTIEFLKDMNTLIPIGDIDSAIEYLEKEKANWDNDGLTQAIVYLEKMK